MILTSRKPSLIIALLSVIFFVGCSTPQVEISGSPIKVAATTTIVGDVVSEIGGDFIDLEILLPAGSDPHSFQPAPKDLVTVAEAKLVFANGAGLEEFLEPLIQNAGGNAQVVEVSEGIDLLQAQDGLVAARESLAQAHFEVAVADLTQRRAAGIFPDQ